MDSANKFQSLIILAMAVIGILLGLVPFIAKTSEYFITPTLMIMLFLVFIQIPLKDITKSFKNIKFTITAILMNFIWTPILVLILGMLFLTHNPDLRIGFVMLTVTPCTDWYLIFTAKAKGNVTLGASLLPLNFVLQLLLLPIYILLLSSSTVDINIIDLLKGIIISLVIPLILAIITRKFLISSKKEDLLENIIIPKSCDFQGYFLDIAIIAMFASQGELIVKNPKVLLILLIPLLLFFIINFILGQAIGKFLKLSYEDNTALNLTTLARNSPIALTIAVSSFPDKPLIALALIIGPLIELPVLFLVTKILTSLPYSHGLKIGNDN